MFKVFERTDFCIRLSTLRALAITIIIIIIIIIITIITTLEVKTS